MGKVYIATYRGNRPYVVETKTEGGKWFVELKRFAEPDWRIEAKDEAYAIRVQSVVARLYAWAFKMFREGRTDEVDAHLELF